MTLTYNTRDSAGVDIKKDILIKEYKDEDVSFTCKICNNNHTRGIPSKKIVSSNFTDWQYIGDYICGECSKLFSLYTFSYIIDNEEIRLLNIREMAEEIKKPQKVPFKIVVSKSQKKHLFYYSNTNFDNENFIVSLETEQIQVNLIKLRELFGFVENLQALGESKQRLMKGEIRTDILAKVGYKALLYLQKELKSRQIQIPLHLSQKPNKTEEEAKCNLDLILKA